jgi:PilZ domain
MQLRRQHRIAYQTRIRLKAPDRDESVVARVQNLSPHGVFVTASDLPDAGTEVICRLDLAGQHRTVRGRVAWVRRPSSSSPEKSPGAGIEFLDLDDRDAELLNRVVEPDPRESKPVDVWFEGMAAPIRCQAAVLGEGVRLATRLPFLRLNSTVRVSFGNNGGGNEEGTLEAVVLEPSSEDGVPRLQLNVSLLAREQSTGSPLEIDLDRDPELQQSSQPAEVTPPPSPAPPPVEESFVAAAARPDKRTLTSFPPYPSLPEPGPAPDRGMAQLLGGEQVSVESAASSDPTHITQPVESIEAGEAIEAAEAIEAGEAIETAESIESAEAAEPATNGAAPSEEALDEGGSTPLVSHMVRLGPPPLPALRHRRQGPEAEEKTPTVSDSGNPTTIPPMALPSTPMTQTPRRRGVWALAAVAVAAVAVIGIVRFQRRNASTAVPAAPAVVESRGPEAMPLNPSAEPPAAPVPPASKPPAAAAAPSAEPSAPATISQARAGTLVVAAAGPTSRLIVPLVGTSLGARRQLLTDPSGVKLVLPRGRPKAGAGTYRPAGTLVTVEVVPRGRGSEVRFLYDPEGNDVSMQLDPRRVILQLKKK